MKQFIKAMLISGMVFAGATCVCAANKAPAVEQNKPQIEKSESAMKVAVPVEEINSMPEFEAKGKEVDKLESGLKKKAVTNSLNTLENNVAEKPAIEKEQGASKSISEEDVNEKPAFEINTKAR